jgi:succinate dehydrogenase hydrophobic anchor subunit
MTTSVRRSGISGSALWMRRTRWELARIVSLITAVVVTLIVIAIVLVLLDANRNNEIVDWLIGAGQFLAEPFDNVFEPEGRKARIGVNWGLAAVVYAFVGGLISRLVR